jgi:hypothetical protein
MHGSIGQSDRRRRSGAETGCVSGHPRARSVASARQVCLLADQAAPPGFERPGFEQMVHISTATENPAATYAACAGNP